MLHNSVQVDYQAVRCDGVGEKMPGPGWSVRLSRPGKISRTSSSTLAVKFAGVVNVRYGVIDLHLVQKNSNIKLWFWIFCKKVFKKKYIDTKLE